MSRRDDWDYEDDGGHVGGRSTQRDYDSKYRHKIYEYDEDDLSEEEYYDPNAEVFGDTDEE